MISLSIREISRIKSGTFDVNWFNLSFNCRRSVPALVAGSALILLFNSSIDLISPPFSCSDELLESSCPCMKSNSDFFCSILALISSKSAPLSGAALLLFSEGFISSSLFWKVDEPNGFLENAGVFNFMVSLTSSMSCVLLGTKESGSLFGKSCPFSFL